MLGLPILRRVPFCLFFLLLFIPLKGMAEPEAGLHSIGKATEIGTKKIVYIEEFQEIYKGGKLVGAKTIYKDPSGKVFARKQVSFPQEIITPTFMLTDERDGSLEAVTYQQGKAKLIYKKNRNESVQEKLIKIPDSFVVDAGIHYFVHKNWDALMKGKDLEINFAVASAQDFFNFKVSKTNEWPSEKVPLVEFTMEINNWLLQSVVDPIKVTYSVPDKRLFRYKGISLINNEEGKSYRVTTKYEYPE